MQEITYTEKQSEFLEAVKQGKNIFLTGKAGTGKSFVVKEAMKIMKEDKKQYVAVAPTGIAANNIKGQTIHSLFALRPFGILSYDTCNFISNVKRDVLRRAEAVIIDEVSMLRPDVVDAMHLTLKKNGLKGLDRRQIILVGDMKQLPPIIDDNSRSVLYETYEGDTWDHAQVVKKLDLVTIDLDVVVRQSDPEFIEALNVIREGGKHEYFRRFVGKEPNGGVILAPHNATVMQYNRAGLEAQTGELHTFTAEIEGDMKAGEFNLEQEVNVKNGCKIIYLVNSKDNPLRNGTLGEFFTDGTLKYFKYNETLFALEQYKAVKNEYVYNKEKDELELRELGSITQYPFKLAYAISIHKSQGLTFDECTIDLRRPCFQPGQMYVALSRVKTPAGLRIITN